MQRTILVADDDNSLMQRVRHALEEQGYGVRVAHTSEEVINQVMTQQIDLLVLGHTLPGQGGLAVLQRLRHDLRISALPIIMLTADIEEADVYHAWNDGVDSFQSIRESALPTLTFELSVKIKRIFKSLEEDKLTESNDPPL